MVLKNLLSFRFKYKVLLFLQHFKAYKYFEGTNLDPEKKYAFIFLAADYGNLGDIAITYAQTKFIQENSSFVVMEIPISKSLEGLRFVKRHIKKGDIVTTVGGGNFGDIYDQIEFIRQLVVRSFPKNRIISFPQTFHFSKSVKGKKALKRAEKAYKNHNNLIIVAREEISFKSFQNHFRKATIILVPDIVLSLNQILSMRERKGVVMCMRNDKEKKLTENESILLYSKMKARFKSIILNDTVIKRNRLTVKERINELSKIWDTFSRAELIVTDRLHGMIFCYITNTPCLVFLNNNHKISETFRWFKNCNNIILMASFSESEIDNFLNERTLQKDNWKSLMHNYKPLITILNS